MPEPKFKLGVVKLGCIGVAPLSDLILDERADRDDLEARAFTSGAKLDPAYCAGPVSDAVAYAPDLVLLVSPNAALPGPTKARETLAEGKIPTISLSDGPSKKIFLKKNDEGKLVADVPEGQGFVVFPGDPMLGARREFLDPTEMSLFNADAIKVLAATGVTRLLQRELNRVIDALKQGAKPEMPKLVATPAAAVDAAGFANPYAAAKAFAALTISEAVAGVSTKACFAEKNPENYIPMVAAAHEMMRSAARLADEAREIEKQNDSVSRTPHAANGEVRHKTELMEKPR